MIETDFLSVPELAERWKQSQRQILEHALALRLPTVFLFDGLAIDRHDRWHLGHGAHNEERELDHLRTWVAKCEKQIQLNARGQADEFERLSRGDVRELRLRIIEKQERIEELTELLSQRERERFKRECRSYMGALPLTLMELTRSQETIFPSLALHPSHPARLTMFDGKPCWDGRLMSLEPGTAPWKPRIGIADLLIPMSVIKAIEASQSESEAPAKHVTKAQRQEGAILATLREMGFDSVALPPSAPGRATPKAKVREQLLRRPDLFTKGSFAKAWQRLRDSKEIKENDQ